MAERLVDPRGLRVSAGITAVVLSVALLTENIWVLAFQALMFALGTVLGPGRSPYGLLFRSLVRPRLRAPQALEPESAPRFAQGVGLGFTLIGLAGYGFGVPLLGPIAVALALIAAILNAGVGFCLGCEVYLLAIRLLHKENPRYESPA